MADFTKSMNQIKGFFGAFYHSSVANSAKNISRAVPKGNAFMGLAKGSPYVKGAMIGAAGGAAYSYMNDRDPIKGALGGAGLGAAGGLAFGMGSPIARGIGTGYGRAARYTVRNAERGVAQAVTAAAPKAAPAFTPYVARMTKADMANGSVRRWSAMNANKAKAEQARIDGLFRKPGPIGPRFTQQAPTTMSM